MGDKILDFSVFCYLWQLWTVSKGVWQEKDFRLFTKFLFKEMLTIQKLPSHGLTRRHIAVKFNPSATHNLKGSIFNSLFQSFIEFRIILLEPPVVSSRGSAEFEALVFEQVVDELKLCRPASRNFPLGFSVRPKPGSIYVTVADGVDLVL